MLTTEKVVWIEKKPTVCFGKPVIRGTRIPVGVILGALADGMTVDEVADAYQIPTEAVQAALEYSAEQVKKALVTLASGLPDESTELTHQEVRRILKLLAKWL
ncbi:MAG: DUF433 domain-containing protein [Armatimonadetes bacterium]|nr:DUF433 domain-containing protein [Armatimonadota bacterium]